MIYLTKQRVIRLNKKSYFEHGGSFTPPFNLLHEENLDYVLDIVQSEMFGEPLYPTLADKTAVYFYNIICNHIFQDGNKRTGLVAALVFLNLNNFEVNPLLDESIIYDFTIEVASGKVTLDECRVWFAENIVEYI
jgi:death on curing protein